MTSRHNRYPYALRRVAIATVLVLGAWVPAGVAQAAPPAPAKKAATHTATPTAARHPHGPASVAGKRGVRTLDAIQIEGEIAVPQVLFITARDFRRFRDGVGIGYEPSALDVARAVTLPVRLRVVGSHQMTKEEGR